MGWISKMSRPCSLSFAELRGARRWSVAEMNHNDTVQNGDCRATGRHAATHLLHIL